MKPFLFAFVFLFSTAAIAQTSDAQQVEQLIQNSFDEIFSKYDLPLRLQGRICVPFLSKTATWSSDENSLYITMYPPPPVEENGATLLVRFGEGMEACFDSLGEYENNSVGNEVGKDTIDHQEEGSD